MNLATPHYILYGKDKILPYESLNTQPNPVYNEDDFIKNMINRFQMIHQRIRSHMATYTQSVKKQHNKSARKVNSKEEDTVMAKLHVPLAESNKLLSKFSGPHKIIAPDTGNKFKIQHLQNGEVTNRIQGLKIVKLLNGHALTIEDENINNENSPENSEDR